MFPWADVLALHRFLAERVASLFARVDLLARGSLPKHLNGRREDVRLDPAVAGKTHALVVHAFRVSRAGEVLVAVVGIDAHRVV